MCRWYKINDQNKNTFNSKIVQTSVAETAVFHTSVVGGVVDRNVVYHQSVIFVQHRETWVMSEITWSTQVNESLSWAWRL